MICECSRLVARFSLARRLEQSLASWLKRVLHKNVLMTFDDSLPFPSKIFLDTVTSRV